MKIIATNRDLNYKYQVVDKIECGIVLRGTEVKSLRASKVALKDSFAIIKNGEVFLKNMYISPYEHGNINNLNETRDRKLLLHKEEIYKMNIKIKQGGYTLIPHIIYFQGQNIKIEICMCKGKKLYDKRQDIKEKEEKRKIDQTMKQG